jgi:TPR repeat protein
MGNLGDRLLDGKGFEVDIEEGRKWLRKAAETGDADAMGILGRRLLDGDGFEVDIEEGRKWLRKAAEAGNEDAKKLLEQAQPGSASDPRVASMLFAVAGILILGWAFDLWQGGVGAVGVGVLVVAGLMRFGLIKATDEESSAS